MVMSSAQECRDTPSVAWHPPAPHGVGLYSDSSFDRPSPRTLCWRPQFPNFGKDQMRKAEQHWYFKTNVFSFILNISNSRTIGGVMSGQVWRCCMQSYARSGKQSFNEEATKLFPAQCECSFGGLQLELSLPNPFLTPSWDPGMGVGFGTSG